jgi:hypothetical protein
MQAGRKDAVSVSLWMNDMLERQRQAANAQGGPHVSNNKRAYAGQLNTFIHLRALLVLHERGIFWSREQAASLGKIPPADFTQILL